MSKSKKHLDNLQRIQNVLEDKHEGKIISGYTPEDIERKIGDKWTDSDDVKWEQKNGYRVKLTNTGDVGIWETCSDCSDPILKPWDKHMHDLHGRCRYCQINFEAILRSYPCKYFAYIRLKELQMMKDIEKEMELRLFETYEENKGLWDRSVVNALANENIDTNNVKL